MTIDVRVDFFGIERTVIIGVSTVKDIVRTGFPGFFQPEGKGQAFVIFQIVPGSALASSQSISLLILICRFGNSNPFPR